MCGNIRVVSIHIRFFDTHSRNRSRSHNIPTNIGAFCLRMRENRSVRLQMADFKGFVSFVMVFMKNMD
jgi:hypothetical protein